MTNTLDDFFESVKDIKLWPGDLILLNQKHKLENAPDRSMGCVEDDSGRYELMPGIDYKKGIIIPKKDDFYTGIQLKMILEGQIIEHVRPRIKGLRENMQWETCFDNEDAQKADLRYLAKELGCNALVNLGPHHNFFIGLPVKLIKPEGEKLDPGYC